MFEIYENALILWSADLEEPVHVSKYCSSLDVIAHPLQTCFGLEYGLPADGRAGTFYSDDPGLVIFSNYSFLTDLGSYNSVTDTFTMWGRQRARPRLCVPNGWQRCKNRVAYSASILDLRLLPGSAGRRQLLGVPAIG